MTAVQRRAAHIGSNALSVHLGGNASCHLARRTEISLHISLTRVISGQLTNMLKTADFLKLINGSL